MYDTTSAVTCLTSVFLNLQKQNFLHLLSPKEKVLDIHNLSAFAAFFSSSQQLLAVVNSC